MKFHQSNFFAKERVLKSTDIVSHGLFSISGTLFLESDAAAVVVVFFFSFSRSFACSFEHRIQNPIQPQRIRVVANKTTTLHIAAYHKSSARQCRCI